MGGAGDFPGLLRAKAFQSTYEVGYGFAYIAVCTKKSLKMSRCPGPHAQCILSLPISGSEGTVFRVEHKPVVWV